MPLQPGTSNSTVSKNISEFHKGDTYAHTKDKFGKKDADKQAVAASLHERDKSKGEDHKAAVSKMHPEHVHRLVQDAHAGKFGPEAQKVAQNAMQAPQQAADGMSDGDADDAQGGSQYADMFGGGGGSAPAAPAAPPSHAEMFGGRRG